MAQWEYRVIYTDEPIEEDILDSYGKQGFQLVTTLWNTRRVNWITYLKRQSIYEQLKQLSNNIFTQTTVELNYGEETTIISKGLSEYLLDENIREYALKLLEEAYYSNSSSAREALHHWNSAKVILSKIIIENIGNSLSLPYWNTLIINNKREVLFQIGGESSIAIQKNNTTLILDDSLFDMIERLIQTHKSWQSINITTKSGVIKLAKENELILFEVNDNQVEFSPIEFDILGEILPELIVGVKDNNEAYERFIAPDYDDFGYGLNYYDEIPVDDYYAMNDEYPDDYDENDNDTYGGYDDDDDDYDYDDYDDDDDDYYDDDDDEEVDYDD